MAAQSGWLSQWERQHVRRAGADEVGGRYCENCHVSEVTDGLISPVSEGVRSYALDPDNARALWAKSEDMVGERF